ncbi:hypothetical protein BJF78_25620 [Pseudonocardia sp. CNS-139]|nr:hypothetical protein BJF78_25620 [Pseudonocardia sp. CNS-139]
MAQLQTGEADVVYEIPPEQAPTLAGDDVAIVNVPLAQTLVLYLRNNQNSPLDDPRVRQAIAYGLDVDAIARATLGDYAKLPVSGGIAVDGSFGYNPDLAAYPHDPDRAKQLLAEAGYPDGFTVQFDATQGRYAKDRDAAQIVASQLAEIGITVNVNFMESGLYLSKLFSSALSPMFMMGQNSAPTYDNGTSFSSICTGPIQASNAEPWLCDTSNQLRSVFDDAQRRQMIFELDRFRHDQAYIVQLFQLPGIYGISTKVQGLQMEPDYSFRDYLAVELTG